MTLPPLIEYATRFEQTAHQMWLFLQAKLTTAQCQQLYGLERDIKHPGILAHKFNQLLKSFIIPVLEMEAQDHVVQRLFSLSCPYRPSFSFLEWLTAQTLHAIGAVPRYSILRWALGEDSDLWFTLRTNAEFHRSRTQSCCMCGRPGRNYPLGPAYGSLCNNCCMSSPLWHLLGLSEEEKNDYTAWSSVRIPCPPDHLTPLHTALLSVRHPVPEHLQSSCPFCHGGANTIEHWLFFCPLPHMVMNALSQSKQWKPSTMAIARLSGARCSSMPPTLSFA